MMSLFARKNRPVAPGPKRKLPLPIPFLVLGMGFFGFALLVSTKPETKPVDAQEVVWSVAARTVAYTMVEPRITAFGQLQAKKQVNLRAMVSGEVLATGANFQDGARVSKGEWLLRLDPFPYETRLAEAEAQLKGAKALLDERKASVRLAYAEFQRAKKLAVKGTVSQKVLEDRRTEHTIQKSRRDQQKSVVERLAVQVQRAARDLKNTEVLAPFDGYISNVTARQGRVLNPNDLLGTLHDADNYEVVFTMTDDEYGRFLLRNSSVIGRTIDVVWEVGAEKITLQAEIERVGAQISQSTRGVEVYAGVRGKISTILRGGAFVTVDLVAQPVPNVMAIPKDAIYGEDRVYLIRDGRLVAHQLTRVIDDGAQVLVREGLTPGDQILLTRFNEAAPGVAVNVLEQG